jgi:tRNA (guanine-N7-)-methyltransferase
MQKAMHYFCPMARKKLARFKENAQFAHVIEPQRQEVLKHFSLKGQWGQRVFKNENPIVLELGCGKGEYTVALAKKYPQVNFIGIDIKGARIWYGAKAVADEDLTNAAFLRTQIELINFCFAAAEVSEIWITFPDPHQKISRTVHRLTHPDFLKRYTAILKPQGLLHLKTDSAFLHGYTQAVLQTLGYPILEGYYDIDLQLRHQKEHVLHTVQTHYENLFREKGAKITYLKFQLEK